MSLQLFAEQQITSGFKTPGFYFGFCRRSTCIFRLLCQSSFVVPFHCHSFLRPVLSLIPRFSLLLAPFCSCASPHFLSFPCIVTSAQLHSSASVSHPLIKIGVLKLKLSQYVQKWTVSLLSAFPTMVADNIHIQ